MKNALFPPALLVAVLLLAAVLLSFQTFAPERFSNPMTVADVLPHLRVHSPPFPLVRLGNDHDGGYVICDGLEYDSFLSAGISTDITFEDAFLQRHPNLICHAFDGTIDRLPYTPVRDRIVFHKKNIGAENTSNLSNLHPLLDQHHNVFLKMDIEGGEYDWIPGLTPAHQHKMMQIVMEFHHILDSPARLMCLTQLLQTHWLVHLHANNCSDKYQQDGRVLPHVFEVTLLNKALVSSPLPCNRRALPLPDLDMVNCTHASDIPLHDVMMSCTDPS